ncbi:uncharacterized protein JCM6883_006635 [Sporobolomyces salmoneus]|uniref:uncharacterized protein n=1 Tax=Sporobolomyces salmoneus TaxID=183962 RepID=UPI00316C1A29
MSLPPPSEILSTIRSSCESVSLPLNESAIDEFIHSVPQDQWSKLSTNHGVRLPLKFDSALQELNLLATLGLLNFLSGYRKALHRLTTRGAYSTILSIVLSAYLTSSSPEDESSILSTRGMLSANVASIAALAQITTHSESDHPTLGPAVKVGTKDPEAFEILELLVGVLHETGKVLEDLGMKNLGEWFEGELCRTNGDSGAMIHSMATTFPAFKDVHSVNGKPVYLFKKALWTLNAIHTRFSNEAEEGTSFPVPKGIENFPVFADNVLPSMLIHFKILPTPSSLSPVPSPTVLRASSVHACHLIVKRAHELSQQGGGGGDKEWLKDWTEVGLDGYLWSLAKEGTYREGVERAVEERGTVYY